MILAQIKPYIEKSDIEQLATISKDEVFEEIVDVYKSIKTLVPNMEQYNALITDIVDILLSEETTNVPPFLERAYLITSYMMSKGMDSNYFLYLFSLVPAAEIVSTLLPLVEDELLYQLLEDEYDHYISRSLGLIKKEYKALQDHSELSKEQLETLVEKMEQWIDLTNKNKPQKKVEMKKLN